MRVTIITTGGTIEKVYDEGTGALRNVRSVLDEILRGLRLHDVTHRHVPIMSKDSLEMNDDDRRMILSAVEYALVNDDAVIVVHGTDTLPVTGEYLHAKLAELSRPIILTGAMRPYIFRDTDAFQNLTEALLAARLLPAGVYCVMHNRVLRFPGVLKDRENMTFAGGSDFA
ncbi:L-asparaginase 1 [Phycisphaerae bacterium RAS1]|nr:L-asparaginase 1 [Phycisphaerae bacterium RAS1]